MSAYQTYAWERATFPNQFRTMIQPEFRNALTRKLARAYKINGVEVSLNCGAGRGWCRKTFWGWQISLPRPDAACSLGVIIHEVAHAYAGQNETENVGHSKKFKRALIKIMVESKRLLSGIFSEIRNDVEKAGRIVAKVTERETLAAQKRAAATAFKKTRRYRIEKLQERIKRLETRRKATETRLKSARRSLNTLERLEAAKQQEVAV